jgi:histidinol-phosphate aminotransferase
MHRNGEMMKPVIPRQPDPEWLQSFLSPGLLQARCFSLRAVEAKAKLDQNENPWDWPDSLKDKVIAKLRAMPWNRYPLPYTDHLADLVAQQAGTEKGSVLLGPGSNYLISILLSTFTQKIKGDVFVARPSFGLYEMHCQFSEIPYKPWPLSLDLEYDPRLLAEMKPHSLAIFASPNNPVGNVLPKEDLITLLEQHPQSLFVADEAYVEFAREPYTDLLREFSNLILVRTLSKTMSSAGIRLGYLLGHASYLEQLRKLRLPFLLNHFAIAASEVLMTDPSAHQQMLERVKTTIAERNRLYQELAPIAQKAKFRVKNTEANFLLLIMKDNDQADFWDQKLSAKGILLRNVSKGPSLKGCLRLTVGTPEQNDKVLEAFAALAGEIR